jgi:hypothetical protein
MPLFAAFVFKHQCAIQGEEVPREFTIYEWTRCIGASRELGPPESSPSEGDGKKEMALFSCETRIGAWKPGISTRNKKKGHTTYGKRPC